MFSIYTMSFKNETYVGMTSNLSNRKSLHKARFEKKTLGFDYFVYRSLRKLTKSFDKIQFNVIKTFSDKESALLYEEKMIRKVGSLNTQMR